MMNRRGFLGALMALFAAPKALDALAQESEWEHGTVGPFATCSDQHSNRLWTAVYPPDPSRTFRSAMRNPMQPYRGTFHR